MSSTIEETEPGQYYVLTLDEVLEQELPETEEMKEKHLKELRLQRRARKKERLMHYLVEYVEEFGAESAMSIVKEYGKDR